MESETYGHSAKLPAGSVNLQLRLNFAAPGHQINLGALALLVDE
jgi:hypothetical protein